MSRIIDRMLLIFLMNDVLLTKVTFLIRFLLLDMMNSLLSSYWQLTCFFRRLISDYRQTHGVLSVGRLSIHQIRLINNVRQYFPRWNRTSWGKTVSATGSPLEPLFLSLWVYRSANVTYNTMNFEVLTAVNGNNTVYSNVTPCSSVGSTREKPSVFMFRCSGKDT